MMKMNRNPLSVWARSSVLAAGAMFASGSLSAAEPQQAGNDAFFRQIGYRAMQQEGGAVPQPEIPQHAPEYPAPSPAAEAPAAEPGPWTFQSLFDDACGQNFLKDNGITFGGWTQFGYQSNPDGAFTGNGVALNQREWDRLNLNQQWFWLTKTADGSKGFDWGFRADMIYGVDGNDTQAFGNPPGTYDFANGWDHGIYEWALPQLYAEFAYDKMSVKVGHFFTPVGYEVVPSNGNFFLSRQLTFYNSEPFTHTGALGTYKATDKLQVLGGWTAGWDTGFQQFNDSSAFLGGFIWQMAEKTSLTYMMTAGNFGVRGDGSINSVILSHAWCDKLTSVHQFDVLGTNSGTNFAATGQAGDSISQINYLFYQVNDKLKAGFREEWYKADSRNYYTVTYGFNYFPCKNLVIRPELRTNLSSDNGIRYGNNEPLFNQNIFGIDAILTY